MSYIVLRSRGDNWYKYEIESYREEGRVKKRQKYLGPATKEEIADWRQKRGIQRRSPGGKPLRRGQPGLTSDLKPFPLPRQAEPADSLVADQRPAAGDHRPPELLWYLANPDRQDPRDFLAEWLPKFREKFGKEASIVYVNEVDAQAIEGNGLGIKVEGCKRVPPWCYQIA